ncbi:hypothetical protein HDE_04967 [Halotydeus destructor]|nr:hypothetical protein HDE_04967 [Halotydeus destructor]
MKRTVEHRFVEFSFQDIPCRIAIYDLPKLRAIDINGEFHQILHDINRYATTGLNCSELVTRDFSSGELDEYGNYSGTVGMIQRGEIDYASSSHMRLDCLASESLGALATFSAADVRIVSPILNTINITDRFEPLLETLALVDVYSYLALSVTMMVVAFFMAVGQVKGRCEGSFVSRVATHLAMSLWRIFELVVSQGKVGNRRPLLRSVWLMLTVGLFVVISGFFSNMLQTEKVAQRRPQQLETIEDIIGNKFNSAEPTILTELFSYPLSKLVKKGTKESSLFDKIGNNKENLYALNPSSDGADFATSKRTNFVQVMKEAMAAKNRYLLYEDILWKSLRPVLCHTMPENFEHSHTSKGTLLGGLITFPYRKNTDRMLKVYMEYRLKNYFEMGLSGTDYMASFRMIIVLIGQFEEGKKGSYMCLAKMSPEDNVSEMQFELQHARVFMKFLIAIFAMAVVSNIIEVPKLRAIDINGELHQVLHNFNRYATTRLNCSELVTSDISSGEQDEYGNYSGSVGMIQRGEIDYASSSHMRLDCLASESLGALATFSEADVRIVSPILNTINITDRFEPLLETLALVDVYSYLALSVTMMFVAFLMAVGQVKSRREGSFVSRVTRHIIFLSWRIFELVVSQGKFGHKRALLRSVWLMFTVGLFVVISGFFSNMLQTEKVAQRRPQQLETIEDIIGNKFNSAEPTILTELFSYPLSKRVKKGTKERSLFEKIGNNKENLYVLNPTSDGADFTTSKRANFIFLMEEAMVAKNRYLLYEDILWKSLRPVLCHTMPKNFRYTHTSKGTLFGGLITIPYRKNTDYRLKQYMEYRLKNYFEMGLSGTDYKASFKIIVVLIGQYGEGKNDSYMCLAKMSPEDNVSEMRFELQHTRVFMKLLIVIFVMATISNIMEIVIRSRRGKVWSYMSKFRKT